MGPLHRSKQAGIERDLSAGLTPDRFAIDDLARYGVNSLLSVFAYDPVQSLLAVGTNETKFGRGQVYVFGRARVQATFSLKSRASVCILRFAASKLVCLDSSNELSVFALDTKKRVACHAVPGRATALTTDPALDFAFVGTQSGDILMYDLERQLLAPLKIPNLWSIKDPRTRLAAVESLQFHPRDIGLLLIGYTHGAVIYSFKQAKATTQFLYELPRGAPGGDTTRGNTELVRRPKLLQAIWHPTGTFVLTTHEDGSLVFWDIVQPRIVMARSVSATNIHLPGASAAAMKAANVPKEPLRSVMWCANQDPDDTALLIVGGAPLDRPQKGLTLLELGRTPVYAASSWEVLGKHFETPKRQHILPTPPDTTISAICLIPRQSPHFAGAQDPIAILAALTSGEMISLSFPSGIPIPPTNQYHPSLTFVHPFIRKVSLCTLPRDRWMGMIENRSRGPSILRGGAPGPLPLKRYETRNIVSAAHTDGTVRLWDAGHADELENSRTVQIDVGRALGRADNCDIRHMSLSGTNAEFAAGLRSGEVVIFRLGRNPSSGRDRPSSSGTGRPGTLTDIQGRGDPTLKDGFCPLTLLNCGNGPISALKVSDVGFVAAGTEGGSLVVIDLRGPAIIHNESIQALSASSKTSSRKKSSTGGSDGSQYATCLEFSVMTLEGEGFSSILLHAGTTTGDVATFKILPDSSGRYSVQYAGSNTLGGRIVHLAPINSLTGNPAQASPSAVANLAQGERVEGVLVAVTQSDIRVFRPPTSKGTHKVFDNIFCDAAAVARYMDFGHAIVGVFGDGSARAYSLPALKEIAGASIRTRVDVSRLTDAHVTESGNILAWTGPSEMILLSVWGTGKQMPANIDTLFNPDGVVPPRPAISNFERLTGTQYITPADMELLIGGPGRVPSQRMQAQSAVDARQQQQQLPMRGGRPDTTGSSSVSAQAPMAQASASGAQTEGYMAYMSRQVSERTAKLGTLDDNMQDLSNSSAQFASTVSDFVKEQKRRLLIGTVKSKFGL